MKKRDELLERYWKGETTLEEESQLREHFAENPPQDEVSLLFSFFHEEGKRKLDREVEVKRPVVRMVNMRSVLSIAASLLVVIASYFLLDPALTNGNTSGKVVEDPSEALEVTLNALSLLDIKMTEGQSTISESIKHFDKTNIIKS